MKIFDNVTEIVRDDMVQTIKRGSKVSIAAACFSMYAYNILKKQLESIDEFRFIFTSPTCKRNTVGTQKKDHRLFMNLRSFLSGLFFFHSPFLRRT